MGQGDRGTASLSRHYDPGSRKIAEAVEGFRQRPGGRDWGQVVAGLERLGATPDIDSAVGLVDAYFSVHEPGDTRSLRALVSAFASKRTTRSIVRSLRADEVRMREVASRSYAHPIGFDKLVLHHHPAGHKLRLHVYWRTPQDLKRERIHLHRFEMASSPITGELTNHLYAVDDYSGEGGIERHRPVGAGRGQDSGDSPRDYYVYTGYERDAEGVLHHRYLGRATLRRTSALTFVPGQTYAQALAAAHYVETNAETGHTNGDVCSTMFVHGPYLRDGAGRSLAVLFEDERTEDRVVTPCPRMSVDQVDGALGRYLELLDESIRFYEWLYDPKYGRDLSVGMVAGYLLSESFQDRNTIELWEKHRSACAEILDARSQTLRRLIDGELRMADFEPGDRSARYFQHLINKAYEHGSDPADWFARFGNLNREMDRYAGALVGDYARNAAIKVLKPIWELSDIHFTGGAHYGRVKAMLDAVGDVEPAILDRFRAGRHRGDDDGTGPVTETDLEVHRAIERALAEHYPTTPVAGEHARPKPDAPGDGDVRWLLDAIDGTRNFMHRNSDFAVSVAHERFEGGRWRATEAVVVAPARKETFWADRGQGAYHVDATGFETRLRAAAESGIDGSLVDLSVRGLGDRVGELTERLDALGVRRRATGSAALAIAKVAGCGNSGAVVTANDYDVAAALLVAREAGAVVVTRAIERPGFATNVYVVAQWQDLADALIRELAALAP